MTPFNAANPLRFGGPSPLGRHTDGSPTFPARTNRLRREEACTDDTSNRDHVDLVTATHQVRFPPPKRHRGWSASDPKAVICKFFLILRRHCGAIDATSAHGLVFQPSFRAASSASASNAGPAAISCAAAITAESALPACRYCVVCCASAPPSTFSFQPRSS